MGNIVLIMQYIAVVLNLAGMAMFYCISEGNIKKTCRLMIMFCLFNLISILGGVLL